MQLAHEFEPVRHTFERAQRVGDRVIGKAGRTSRSSRGGGVRAIVCTGHARLCRQRVVRGEVLRTDLRLRALEDAQLRVAIGLERPMPVEMVGLEVEQDCDVARERHDVLELEARELAHDPRPRLHGQRNFAQGHVLVAGEHGVDARRGEHRAQ